MRLLLLLLGLAPLSLAAQPLTTDRPDFTESPSAVAPGRIQIEAGTTLQSFGGLGDDLFADFTELTLPEALVRIGVTPGVEARVQVPDYVRTDLTGRDIAADGFTDPSVGLKVEVGTFAGADVGAIVSTSVPVSDEIFGDGDALGGERFVPSVIVTGSADLTPTVSVGAQIQSEFFGEGNADFGGDATIGGTLVVGLAINEQTGAFAELVLEDVIGGIVNPYALVHTGATLLLTPDAQLDAHAGIGLAGYAPDYLIGVGASVRI